MEKDIVKDKNRKEVIPPYIYIYIYITIAYIFIYN